MSPPPIPLAHGRASKYLDRHFNRQAMKILPGEFYATTEDEVIVTVLGSCVAACLLDPIAMVGGMNHFMLPVKVGDHDPDVFFAARYGAAAMEYLINDLLHLGAQRDRRVAKAFGVPLYEHPEIIAMLKGMVKSRRESVDLYVQGKRQDLADKELAEIAVIEHFLPEQMDDAATEAAVQAAIAESGAATMKDMGKVMAILKARHAASLDMSKVNPLVKKLLS